MTDPDLTPEWLREIDLVTALGNIIFDIGKLAAQLTMLQQRVSDLVPLIAREVNDDTNTTDTE